MSKEKPEVGDVWKKKKADRIIHIYFIEEWAVNAVYKQKNDVIPTQIFIERLKEDYTYIGKAKGSISDLFEVEK